MARDVLHTLLSDELVVFLVAVGREGLSARLNVSTAEEHPEAESIAMTVYWPGSRP